MQRKTQKPPDRYIGGYFMKPLNFITLTLASMTLFGCVNETKESKIENIIIPTERSYKEVLDYQLTLETIFDVDSDCYYTYFYSETCSHCQILKDFIIEKALERGNIYFINSSSKDQFTTDPNLVIFAENPGDIYILGYPTMLKIEDKKVTKNLVGNEEIIKELK